jgi:hypothetical protein
MTSYFVRPLLVSVATTHFLVATQSSTMASLTDKKRGGDGGSYPSKSGTSSASSSSNGFKALNLSDDVYRGIVRMGFRVGQKVDICVFDNVCNVHLKMFPWC